MQNALTADDIEKTGTMLESRPAKRSPKDKGNG
jgi:hypothetical protein